MMVSILVLLDESLEAGPDGSTFPTTDVSILVLLDESLEERPTIPLPEQ